MMQIDMGKFFTAGYLTDIIERDDSGKVKFYFGVRVGEGDDNKSIYKYTPVNSFDTLAEDAEAFAEANGVHYCNLCVAINTDKIDALIGTFFKEEVMGDEYSDENYYHIWNGI
jgi:hypothetical protein